MFDTIKKAVGSLLIIHKRKDSTIQKFKEELAEATRKCELLANSIGDTIWDWDIANNKIVWSDGFRTMFGYEDFKDLHSYASWFDNIHPADREEVITGLKEVFDQEEPSWKSLYRFRCSSGIYKHTYSRGHILYEGGKPCRLIGAIQDIDQRMDALQEVEKLSLVASKTDNLVIITDAQERIEWVNEGLIKRTGYLKTELIGKTPNFLQGPETNQETLIQMRKNVSAGKSVTEELVNYTKTGQKIWLKININPVFDQNKNLVRLIYVATDITAHKDYENKITSIANDLSDLIENANAVIFGTDEHYQVNEWNACAAASIGYSKHEVIGKKLTNFLVDAEQSKNMDKLCEQVLKGAKLSLQQFQIVNRMGGHDTLLVSATPRKNSMGKIIGMLVVGQDITELTEYRNSLEEKVKERTEKLASALTKEKQLVELKNQFVAIASHEFRTPLSTINFTTNFLNEHFERLSPNEVKSKLEKIEKQVVHMTSLLDDVITAGRTELNKIPTNKSKVFLRVIVDKIVEDVLHASKNTHQIGLHFDTTINQIETDEKLLRNILINLLTNAIKFSPQYTKVNFAVKQVGKELSFEIADNGIGIPEEDYGQLFTAFSRGSNTKSIAGTGLGLTIVKKAVDVLGGNLILKSKINVGTTVTVVLPFTK